MLQFMVVGAEILVLGLGLKKVHEMVTEDNDYEFNEEEFIKGFCSRDELDEMEKTVNPEYKTNKEIIENEVRFRMLIDKLGEKFVQEKMNSILMTDGEKIVIDKFQLVEDLEKDLVELEKEKAKKKTTTKKKKTTAKK